MKIVIIDGETAIHGGLNWGPIDQWGDVTEYPLTLAHQVVDRLREVEAVLTNKVPLDGDTIRALPRLRYIGVTATGYNIIDVQAARERKIAVTNVPSYSSTAVAQHVFALILGYFSSNAAYAVLAKNGSWSRSSQFCLLDFPIRELAGKTLGIIGYGEIGKRVAAIARAFEMKILVAALPGREAPEKVPLAELLGSADVVTLHCPLTEQTKELVDSSFLAQMKSDALLINTSRGGLICEADLNAGLLRRTLAHACLDVLSVEPPPPDHPLLKNPYCTITPHIAWATREARQRLIDECSKNLAAFIQGDRRNRID